MCRSKTRCPARVMAAALAAIVLDASLGGCSDIYYARRDTIALSAGDAIAANEVGQMVDPWPPQSGDKNIAFNGQRMQAAMQRYRTNRVIPPVNTTTSSMENAQAAQAAASAESGTQNLSSSAPPVSGAPVQ
jgi:hypothetical protein